jgi:hypothetical protein
VASDTKMAAAAISFITGSTLTTHQQKTTKLEKLWLTKKQAIPSYNLRDGLFAYT